MIKKIFCFFIAIFLASCSQHTIDIKSPCVSLEEGPCGPKRSVNDWWIKSGNFNKNFSHNANQLTT